MLHGLDRLARLSKDGCEVYVQERRRFIGTVIQASSSDQRSLIALQEQIDHIRAVAGSPALATERIISLLSGLAETLKKNVALCQELANESDGTAEQ